MIISVQFYDDRIHCFQGKSYSYLCDLPVAVNNNVRVPTVNGTNVGRVTAVDVPENEIGCSLRMLKRVISVETNPAPDEGAAAPVNDGEPEQLSLLDVPAEREEHISMVVVKQLPVIEENLHIFKADAQEIVKNALSLACTEDTVKDVKKIRAELNAKFKEVETLRKEVKKKILSPYDEFEKVYGECVTDIFAPADMELKRKIDSVENELKRRKTEEVKEYFNEYAISIGLNPKFADFSRSGISVRLSDSDKSLREQAKTFLDNTLKDCDVISKMEFSDEIFAEYRVTRELNTAVKAVNDRHERIARERAEMEEAARIEKERQERLAGAALKVEETMDTMQAEMPPQAVSEPKNEESELLEVSFSVKGSIEQLKALKKFLIDGGYEYVSI